MPSRDLTLLSLFLAAALSVAILLVVLYRRFVQRRALWGPDGYRFPGRGFGVDSYRERLQRAVIDPDKIGTPFTVVQQGNGDEAGPSAPRPAVDHIGDPTENPAHYLGLLEELHDAGVLADGEYDAARLRLLQRLRG